MNELLTSNYIRGVVYNKSMSKIRMEISNAPSDATSSSLSERTQAKAYLSPELLSGLKVLSVSAAGMEEFASAVTESNPLLELDFESDLLRFDRMPAEEVLDSYLDETMAPSNLSLPSDGASFAAEKGFWDVSRLRDSCVESETLQSFLRVQATGLNLPDEDAQLMLKIIESISDDGYYEGAIEQLAFESGVDSSHVRILLSMLQGLQPAGVAQESLEDCLLAQVDSFDPLSDIIRDVIENHLRDLAEGRLSYLAHAYSISLDEMSHVSDSIRHLNPRPGSSFYQRPEFQYIIPDIVVRYEEGALSAYVLGSGRPCLVLSKEYLAMSSNPSVPAEAREFILENARDARAVLRALDARRGMLQNLSSSILHRQAEFFLTGGRNLAPMTMQEIADELGVNVSTVSRAVQGKYMQAQWGCFPLRSLFTHALPKKYSESMSGSVSSEQVKRLIKSLIERETREDPYSDARICELLNAQGIEIKRRTVAKYRVALGIPNQSKRRWMAKSKGDIS